MEVNWKYNLNELADRFEERSVPLGTETIRFEVTEQSANRLTVQLVSQ